MQLLRWFQRMYALSAPTTGTWLPVLGVLLLLLAAGFAARSWSFARHRMRAVATVTETQAELIQHALSTIHIQLEIIGEESSSIANRRSTGDYDLLFNQTWGLAYDPQSTISAFTSETSYLHTTSGIAQANELYSKIDEVMVSTNEELRQSLYADIMRIVHDEAVFIPITNGSVTIVAPSNLDGISFKQTQFKLPFERMSFK